MALLLIIRPEAQLDIENSAYGTKDNRQALEGGFVDGLNEVLTRIAENPIQFPPA